MRRAVLVRYVLVGLLAFVVIRSGVAPRLPVLRARAATMLTPSGEVTNIRVPAVGIDSRVIEVRQVKREGRMEWQVADYAVGHHAESGVPGGGTNIVLSGHNNINGEVFRRLDELKRGDIVELETRSGASHRYEVKRTRLVLEDGASRQDRLRNARYMKRTATERLTLISCWPYKPWPPYRIIVIAEPVEPALAPT
ncbi:MAG: sortase [Chloroflexota bacterium]|nr:sortase [Chloroflexota bacterium]